MDYKEVTAVCGWCGKAQTDKKYASYNPGVSAANNIIKCDDCVSKRISEKQR